jgi:hypothetical protein
MIGISRFHFVMILFFTVIVFITEYRSRDENDITSDISAKHFLIRWSFYCFLISSVMIFGVSSKLEFIYFRF